MKVGLSAIGLAGVAAAALAALSCQTYDFEPVEPLAIAQSTYKTVVVSRASKPNIMLLVDKSGSMTQASGTGTRLSEMKSAMATFLTQSGTSSRLGLAVFPFSESNANCDVACDPGQVIEPIVQSNDVDSELQAQASKINDVIQAIGTSGGLPAIGGTPTAASLTALASVPALQSPDREDFVLLLTDGLPNCNNSLDGNTCSCTAGGSCAGVACNCLDDQNVVNVINALRQKEIRTIVVGFGADTGNVIAGPTLNAMAIAGGFARTCDDAADCGGSDTCDNGVCSTAFYQAANGAELAAALADISAKIPKGDPCEFVLDGGAPSDPSFLVVYIDGEKTGEGNDTWTYVNKDGRAAVMMQGALCDRILNSSPSAPVNVEIRVVQGL